MKIIWNPNPLATVIELDDNDKKLLWHKVKIERLEQKITGAHFALDKEFNVRLKSIGKEKTLDAAVEEALRELSFKYILEDEKRNGKSFNEHISELTNEYIDELSQLHAGDCTCVPCSCMKCHVENLIGIDTIKGLNKHEAYKIDDASRGRSIDEAIEYLNKYKPVKTQEWEEAHIPRWTEEAKRAHDWLVVYRNEHLQQFELARRRMNQL